MRLRSAWLSLFLLLAPPAEAAPAPPATQMVASGGHTIAMRITPGRQPAILLDAGGGLDSSYWASLIPKLSKATGSEIIVYDRSGMGASQEVPGPWDVMAARDDLLAVLKAAHATHKVVLVSHSLAGEIALYTTQAHPGWFAGAVLVDANVPDFYTDARIKATMAFYAPILEQMRAAPSTPAIRQLLAMSQSFEDTSRAFHKSTWPASVPVVVIVSEKTPFEDPALATSWRTSHAQFAKGAANRTLVTATGSSHDVAHDRPDVIIRAVTRLVSKARKAH